VGRISTIGKLRRLHAGVALRVEAQQGEDAGNDKGDQHGALRNEEGRLGLRGCQGLENAELLEGLNHGDEHTRGEAPTAPGIFVRPLFNLFVKGHFENRLRRMRTELVLRDGLSDATRSALISRLDGALERWKTPRFTAVFFSALLPGIISVPGWSKQVSEFAGTVGIPTDAVTEYVSRTSSSGYLGFVFLLTVGYLLAIPVTAFLAKRGLFVGRSSEMVCFPGGQGGPVTYAQETEILGRAGLHMREAPVDLWLVGGGLVFSAVMLVLGWNRYIAWLQSIANQPIDLGSITSFVIWEYVVIFIVYVGLSFVAAVRRRRLGRV
jgi:hypothetical protein